jgi:hypothetical protein
MTVVGRCEAREFFKNGVESGLGIEAGPETYGENGVVYVLIVDQKSFGFLYSIAIDKVIKAFLQAVVDGL